MRQINPDDFGLQIYDADGESSDPGSSIFIFKKFAMPDIFDIFHGYNILDVGCGNGRMNQCYKDLFVSITCIDMHRDIDKRFLYDNVTFEKADFCEYITNQQFDWIVFYGSFYLMCYPCYEKNMEKCYSLLRKNGHILLLDAKGRDTGSGQWKYNLDKMAEQFKLNKIFQVLVGGYTITVLEQQ